MEKGALSGSDLANEPGLGSSRTYRPGETPMPSKTKPGLKRMHQEMNSEAASSGSPLRTAVPPNRAKVGQKVQTDQTMQDLDRSWTRLPKACSLWRTIGTCGEGCSKTATKSRVKKLNA